MRKTVSQIIILFILIIQLSDSFAQIKNDYSRNEIDSMIKLIPQNQNKNLADYYNLVATSISQRYPDSCLFYANKALELSKKLDYEWGEKMANFNIGNGYLYKIDVKNALLKYLEVLTYFKKNSNSETYGDLLLQIGFINRFIGNFPDAINYFKKASIVYLKLNKRISYVGALLELSWCYNQSHLYDSALINTKKCIRKCKSLGLERELASSYNHLGITYLWRSENIAKQERYEGSLAISYFDSALLVNNRLHWYQAQAVNYANLGSAYYDHIYPPQYKIAIQFYNKSIITSGKINDLDGPPYAYAGLTDLYAEMNEHELCKSYLDSCLISIGLLIENMDTIVYSHPGKKLHELSFISWIKSFAYEGYYKMFRKLGNVDSAVYYYSLMIDAENQSQQLETRNHINYLLARAENDIFEKETSVLKKEARLQKQKANLYLYLIIGAGIIFLLIILITIILIRQSKIKTIHEKNSLQQRLFRLQMSPHFIFNSLASIQNLVMKGAVDDANIFIARFSGLIRNILHTSSNEYIKLETELETLQNYLDLQLLRYSRKFTFVINIDPAINTEDCYIPVMLLQPFVENAIEHGIKPKESPGEVRIDLYRKECKIIIKIQDDGIGRKAAQELLQINSKGHQSMATGIIKERIRILNHKSRNKFKLEIIDLFDDSGQAKGTEVILEIPEYFR